MNKSIIFHIKFAIVISSIYVTTNKSKHFAKKGVDHEMKIQANSGFKIDIVIPAEEQKDDKE